MVEIKIDNTGDGTWWLYNNNHGWKDYCGCENFDEQVVLTGNRDFTGCTEAEWYQKAKEILDDIDCYDEYPTDVSDEVNAKLKEMYDFIIIDCPPVMVVSDAIPIGNVVDGTIFICSSKSTNRKDAKSAIEILQKNNVHIIGTVLTQVEDDGMNSKYYYYYYY